MEGILKNKGNWHDQDKKPLKDKLPKYGKGKLSSGSALASGSRKGKVFFDDELRKSNEKLMADIRKALNSAHGKKEGLADPLEVKGL
jgi:hypothetical protein